MNKNIVFALTVFAFFGWLGWRWFAATSCAPAYGEIGDTLIVGTNAEYPPFSFITDGAITGFDIDLIREVAKRLGKQIEIRDMPFSTLLPQLQLGTIHLIAAGMSPTMERARQVSFTKPYIDDGSLVIIARKDQKISENIQDLKDKNVVVNEGFVSDLYVSDQGITARKLPAVADAFLALDRGRADFFVTAESAVQPFFEQYGSDQFNVQPLLGTRESIAFAVSKNNPELLKAIDCALDQIKEDGALVTLQRKWKVG